MTKKLEQFRVWFALQNHMLQVLINLGLLILIFFPLFLGLRGLLSIPFNLFWGGALAFFICVSLLDLWKDWLTDGKVDRVKELMKGVSGLFKDAKTEEDVKTIINEV